MTCKFIGRPSGQAPENKSQYGTTFYDNCFTCSSGRRSTLIWSSSQPTATTAQAPRCAIFSNVLYGRTEHVGKGGGGNAAMEMGLEKADAHSASSLAASPGIVAGGPCANASGPVRHRPRSPRCYTPVPRRAGLAGGLRLCWWHALVAAFAGSYIRPWWRPCTAGLGPRASARAEWRSTHPRRLAGGPRRAERDGGRGRPRAAAHPGGLARSRPREGEAEQFASSVGGDDSRKLGFPAYRATDP